MRAQMTTSKEGGELVSFKLDDVERIHQGKDCIDENGKVYWGRHCPVLFPVVGKVKKNQTIINGRVFDMPQHGFARDQEFEPVTKLDNFHSYVLKSNKNTKVRYPFDFELYNTYRLDENKLTVIYKVINTGDSDMPFGIGSHPAFKIDLADLQQGNYYLEFEEEEKKIHFMYLVDGLIGTEYAKNPMIKQKRIQLDSHTFDNDALIMKGITNKKITLYNKRKEKKVLSVDFEQFPYLGLWSKPNAPFLCIEPWFSMADNLKSDGILAQKSDIIKLKPKQDFSCQYTVEFF